MRELKLQRVRSYTGAVKATRENPVVSVDDETAKALLATGYFAERTDEEPQNAPEAGPAIGSVDYEALAAMTKAELIRLAAENGVDIEGCRTKADILETISVACGGCYTMINLQRG